MRKWLAVHVDINLGCTPGHQHGAIFDRFVSIFGPHLDSFLARTFADPPRTCAGCWSALQEWKLDVEALLARSEDEVCLATHLYSIALKVICPLRVGRCLISWWFWARRRGWEALFDISSKISWRFNGHQVGQHCMSCQVRFGPKCCAMLCTMSSFSERAFVHVCAHVLLPLSSSGFIDIDTNETGAACRSAFAHVLTTSVTFRGAFGSNSLAIGLTSVACDSGVGHGVPRTQPTALAQVWSEHRQTQRRAFKQGILDSKL